MRALLSPYHGGVYELVAYHMGWRDEAGRETDAPAGKMLRPLLCLTAARGYGDDKIAVDAAVAIELLHAFSLVHDDIEDGDRQRRHRSTLWALHGVPLAINAGDCLFALAHRVLIDAAATFAPGRALQAMRVFDDACLRMIEGQHQDLEFESRPCVTLDAYLDMSAGKTGALLGASLSLGAIAASAPDGDVELLREAGVEAGLAFQAIDDALSVWGDDARTGKISGNDVARGKKSLPVVIAAEDGGGVEDAAVRDATFRIASEHADRARALIIETSMSRDGVDALGEIIEFMLRRDG